MFLDLYIQIPNAVSARSSPLLAHQQKCGERAFAHRASNFASSKTELEPTTRALAASVGKAAVAFEHVSDTELSPTKKQNGGTAPGVAMEKERANLT
jgi:hypothetical protein